MRPKLLLTAKMEYTETEDDILAVTVKSEFNDVVVRAEKKVGSAPIIHTAPDVWKEAIEAANSFVNGFEYKGVDSTIVITATGTYRGEYDEKTYKLKDNVWVEEGDEGK